MPFLNAIQAVDPIPPNKNWKKKYSVHKSFGTKANLRHAVFVCQILFLIQCLELLYECAVVSELCVDIIKLYEREQSFGQHTKRSAKWKMKRVKCYITIQTYREKCSWNEKNLKLSCCWEMSEQIVSKTSKTATCIE